MIHFPRWWPFYSICTHAHPDGHSFLLFFFFVVPANFTRSTLVLHKWKRNALSIGSIGSVEAMHRYATHRPYRRCDDCPWHWWRRWEDEPLRSLCPLRWTMDTHFREYRIKVNFVTSSGNYNELFTVRCEFIKQKNNADRKWARNKRQTTFYPYISFSSYSDIRDVHFDKDDCYFLL